MEQISERFYAAADGIVSLFLAEAETEEYPYAVYSHEPVYSYTKDGLYKVASELTCDIYGKDYDECSQISERLKDAVEDQLNDEAFTAVLSRSRKDCYEGKWDIKLVFQIKQLI